MTDKPTHAEELDCLRLQNAMLKKDAAIRVAQDAADAANKSIKALDELGAEMKSKYALADADTIDTDTHEIKRAG